MSFALDNDALVVIGRDCIHRREPDGTWWRETHAVHGVLAADIERRVGWTIVSGGGSVLCFDLDILQTRNELSARATGLALLPDGALAICEGGSSRARITVDGRRWGPELPVRPAATDLRLSASPFGAGLACGRTGQAWTLGPHGATPLPPPKLFEARDEIGMSAMPLAEGYLAIACFAARDTRIARIDPDGHRHLLVRDGWQALAGVLADGTICGWDGEALFLARDSEVRRFKPTTRGMWSSLATGPGQFGLRDGEGVLRARIDGDELAQEYFPLP